MEITLENIFQLFAESEKQRAIERVELEKQRTESEKQRIATLAESEKQHTAKLAESQRVFNENLEKHRIDNENFVKQMTRELNKKIGSLSDIFGMYAQSQTQGRIIKMFEKRGIELRTVTNNYKERNKAGEFLYEIDILLYNTLYAIVVEVKNNLKKDDVDEHLERMEKCTTFPPRGTEGKILLGAVATMIVSEEVERHATRKGFYVIKPSGKSVKIANNSSFKAAEWATKL
jgi:hypothetical protein